MTTISTNPGSMEAGGYGLTRGTCFVARRLEVVAVAGLLWISWRVLAGADFRVFSFDFSSSNANGLLQVWATLASFTSVLVWRPVFTYRHKAGSYRDAYRVPAFD